MDISSMVSTVKVMQDEKDDSIIETYLNLAKSIVLNRLYPFGYTDGAVVPNYYEYVQIEICVFMLNKRGSEGQVSYSENGVSASYENGDIPISIMSKITPMAMALGGVEDETP